MTPFSTVGNSLSSGITELYNWWFVASRSVSDSAHVRQILVRPQSICAAFTPCMLALRGTELSSISTGNLQC